MPLSQTAVVELVRDRLLPAWLRERARIERIDKWYRHDPETPTLPRQASRELRQLVDLARTPWLGLVVTTTAQCMYVDGYRSPEDDRNLASWDTWSANDFEARQVAVHRGALAYGTAYVTVLPGTDQSGAARSVLRGVSPRRMLAVYADPAEDDWPLYAIDVQRTGDAYMLKVLDETSVYYLSADSSGDGVTYIETRTHGVGVCPVVRYANLDLDGRAAGDVEPFIPVAARINRTTLDRLLVQHFGSWKVRTIAGMAAPDDEEAANRAKLRLRHDDILVAEDPDTRFGTLDETPLDGFIAAHASDVEALAAVTQVPSHNLTGQMVNLSAEALAAARASLNQKVHEWQRWLGKSHEQTLRLDAELRGERQTPYTARVSWQDTEIRSMAQAVDALGKAATMLGVPAQALWGRIPGVTLSDVHEWQKLADEQQRVAAERDPLAQFGQTLNRQSTPSE